MATEFESVEIGSPSLAVLRFFLWP